VCNAHTLPQTLLTPSTLPLPWVHEISPCIGLRGKVLVPGGAIGVASVRICWKLPPSPMEPVPAGSKTDPSLAEADSISDGGSASGIT